LVGAYYLRGRLASRRRGSGTALIRVGSKV
jgi:hypothetical protein